jgi:hypothetical protein
VEKRVSIINEKDRAEEEINSRKVKGKRSSN